MPPRPLPRYDASSRTSGRLWLDEELHVRARVFQIVTGAREIVPIGQRPGDGRVHVGRRARRRGLVDRIEPHPPERGVVRIHDQPAQRVLRVLGRGPCANQILAPLRDFGLRLDEIERRNLPGVDADLVLARELPRQIERSLLNGDVRERRLQRPVRLLDRGDGLHRRLAEPQIRALLVALRDDVLRAGRVDGAVLQQRLRKRELEVRPAGSDRSC